MTAKTFTIRLDPRDRDLLGDLALLDGKPVAQLAREILSEGIRGCLDPDAIDRRMNAKRDRLLDAARRIREGWRTSNSSTTERNS